MLYRCTINSRTPPTYVNSLSPRCVSRSKMLLLFFNWAFIRKIVRHSSGKQYSSALIGKIVREICQSPIWILNFWRLMDNNDLYKQGPNGGIVFSWRDDAEFISVWVLYYQGVIYTSCSITYILCSRSTCFVVFVILCTSIPFQYIWHHLLNYMDLIRKPWLSPIRNFVIYIRYILGIGGYLMPGPRNTSDRWCTSIRFAKSG